MILQIARIGSVCVRSAIRQFSLFSAVHCENKMNLSSIENNLVKSVESGKLKENNVRLVGIGVEELGIEEFVKEKFFAGELYIDTDKKSYAALGFKRFSLLSVLKAILCWEVKEAAARGKKMNLGGDMKGDGLQNGGALVVSAGGKEILYSFKQERLAEHVPNETFLKVLGLPVISTGSNDASGSNAPVCNDDVCTLPPKKSSN